MPDSNFDVIQEAFCAAEKAIKDCENLTEELPQGAVNELRYAAAHLINFLVKNKNDELDKYYRHCKRAKYDSKEISVIILRKKIDVYLERYAKEEDIVITIIGHAEYLNILEKRRLANSILEMANNDKENREDYLEKIQETIPLLNNNLALLENTAPAIQNKIKKENSNKFWRNVVVFSTIAGVVLTAIGIIVSKI